MMQGGAVCAACGAPLAAQQQFCTKCGTTVAKRDPLRERLQDLLGAELELQDVVGRGGMAVVYVARDPLLERRVAVKAMLPEFAADPEMSDRFLREARTAAQLQHPNIVSVFGARARGDLLVMLMAFVEGRSLDAVLRDTGPLPLHVVGRLAADMASALQYAHDHKVIHRDVKPGNVLLASNGGALVSDFGIARRQDVPGMTGEGMLLGSLSYMSPEQRSADVLTGATDQYALGVSVFEMLAGRGPFIGAPVDVHVGHLDSPPPSVREFRADVPESVAHAIDRMLAKSPAERFPDLREPRRIFERLVTDARSASAEIAKLSGVLAAPTASRVMSAVRKAPTMSITNPPSPETQVPRDASAVQVPPATLVTPTARQAPPVVSAPSAPAIHASHGGRVILGAVVIAIGILAGAVALKGRRAGQPGVPSAQQASPAADARVSALSDARAASPAPSNASPAPLTSQRADRPAGVVDAGARSPGISAGTTSGVPLPTASLGRSSDAAAAAEPAPPPAAVVEPSRQSAAASAREPVAVLADARAAARALVTLMNQHRARDLERLADADGGDAAARRTLERLVREASDFAAGFAAMASEPESDGNGVRTEFVLDAAWRSGGRDVAAVFDIVLRLTRAGDAWVPSAYSVRARP